MSDQELLRLLDSRAEGTTDALKKKRGRHLDLMTEAYSLEEEIVALSNVLKAVMDAADNIRNGGQGRKQPQRFTDTELEHVPA